MPTYNIFGVPVVVLSKIGDVELDLVQQVTVTLDSLVTQHPVETGFSVSDHVVNLPAKISMSGRFSDLSLGAGLGNGGPTLLANPAQAITSALAGITGGAAFQKWNLLQDLRRRKQPFDVFVQQGMFQGMVFKTLGSPRGPGDGYSLRWTAELQQIITADLLALLSNPNAVSDGVSASAPPVGDQGVTAMQPWST